MGFPTLYFFPGKAKGTPIQYEGAREVEDIAAFIKDKVRASTRAYDWSHIGLPPYETTSVEQNSRPENRGAIQLVDLRPFPVPHI